MAEVIKRFFEIAGNSQQETRECWLFVIGKHGSGKSTLLNTFFENTTDLYRLEPSKSTFGYEYTVIQYQVDTFVHIVEVNETSIKNHVLIDLMKKHAENAAIAVLFDSQELWNVQKTIDELLIPLFETPLSELDPKLANQYSKFLTTLWSDEPVSLGNGVLTMNSGLPIFFIASYPESMESLDDVKFDSYLRYIREPALQFGAGISLTNSKSLLSVIISCILRNPLSKDLREKICNRKDYFLPPGWDSSVKLESIEKVELTNESNEDASFEIKKAQEWQEFLTDLQKEKQEPVNATPVRASAATPINSPQAEPDFLSQFE
ncbi:hypothetical protein TRFO_13711 [Tritrichomonas foetus]|uniref:Dynein light intermediate chain n=1 Tax=Tritrichomonas foetus TaxID=1144522 RepID=A0A1J4KX95_9EUKA|nr:hypothetical protein TRFO_13711 [Tritrichomonas foetus]|eukprot:OHT15875.1 hypothetical protein TRFO_13711 [Tritrichomonas foetus]